MKLIIQIPCFNEANTLPLTLSDLPRRIEGIDAIEYLVVDDGSTDGTAGIAKQHGVHHVVRFPTHQGLAAAFGRALSASLENDADIVVNTDGDNQYRAKDIPLLIQPILEAKADMVIGKRPIAKNRYFPFWKKLMQKAGSWVVRIISKTGVPDATSGFRAFSRDAALRLNVFDAYTYTLETIIQAGRSNIAVAWVPVGINSPTRESRIIKNIPSYVFHSIFTIIRIFVLYKPFRFFALCGSLLLGAGILLDARFVYFYLAGSGSGMVQSLILSAILSLAGFQLFIVGLLADLISTNRRILEDIQFRIRSRPRG